MKVILLSLFLLILCESKAQVHIPRDTSFTILGTFNKEKKYRPYITIAEPETSENVKVKLNVVYDKIGDRALLLDVFYPQQIKNEKYPGVILIHGGGWKSGDKTQMHAMAKVLADKGYVAFAVEYRMSLEAKYPEAVFDLKSAIRWMRANAKQFNLDIKNIASLGVSAGGQLATLLGNTNNKEEFEGFNRGNKKLSSSIQAIVNIDGTLAFRHPESSEGKSAGEWLGGSYEESTKNWESAAPLNHVSAESAPILFINSSIPRFHAGRNDMIKKLDQYGIYSEVQEFPDTPHPFWFFQPWFNPMMDFTITFLNKVFN